MKKWIKAARLRTLPLSVSGIIAGTACAYQSYNEQQNFCSIFILCLLTTLFLQVLSNYANDYGDAVKGTDNENRVGPKRAVQSGEITAGQMKKAIIVMATLSLISALAVIFTAFGKEEFAMAVFYFILGVACVAAAIKYTVGGSAYGYRGFGDIFVFLFFGVVSTVGSYFLYAQQLDFRVFLPAVTIGCLSTAVLNMNNMRDIHNDTVMNKNTLVVKMGFNKARIYHFSLIMVAVIALNTYALWMNFKGYQYIYLIGFVPLIKNMKVVNTVIDPRNLDPELKRVSLSTFFITLLFAIAILLN